MTWQPTPRDALLAPDALLALLDPEPGEDAGVGGYITPSNIKTIEQHLASYTYWLQQDTVNALTVEAEALALVRKGLEQARSDIGDIVTVTSGSIADEFHDIEARLAVLETPPEVPTPEGAITIDMYGGSFVRARSDFSLLDGQPHWATVGLATTAGPNGAVIADLDALRATNAGATWWDDGGSLGKVNSATGSDVPASAVASMIERGRIVQVVHSTGPDGHPLLTVLDSVAPPVDTQTLAQLVARIDTRLTAVEAALPGHDNTITCEVTKAGVGGSLNPAQQVATLELLACGNANGFNPDRDPDMPPMKFVWANGITEADFSASTQPQPVRGRIASNDSGEGACNVFRTVDAAYNVVDAEAVRIAELVAWVAGGKHVVLRRVIDKNGNKHIGVVSVTEP